MKLTILRQLLIATIISTLSVSCTHLPTHPFATQHMHKVTPKLYVDKAMSTSQQLALQHIIKASKSNITLFFGSMKANPVIYACITQKCDHRAIGTARAKSINDTHIFLSSRGLEKTVLTHELVHIELHKRVGNKKAWHRIPMWFDEGLAVMVSKDHRYNQNVTKNKQAVNNHPLTLDQLVSEQQWLRASTQGKQPYLFAKKEVEKWYQKNGHSALIILIAKMQHGEEFTLLKN